MAVVSTLRDVKCFVLKVNELHFYLPLAVYLSREYIYPSLLRFASLATVCCKHVRGLCHTREGGGPRGTEVHVTCLSGGSWPVLAGPVSQSLTSGVISSSSLFQLDLPRYPYSLLLCRLRPPRTPFTLRAQGRILQQDSLRSDPVAVPELPHTDTLCRPCWPSCGALNQLCPFLLSACPCRFCSTCP